LVLSVCNEATIFCLHLTFLAKPTLENVYFSPENVVRGPRTVSLMYLLKEEETHLSKELETHQSFKLLVTKEKNENPLVPLLNTTLDNRMRWFKRNRSRFRILESRPLTKQFSARARGFFSYSCRLCFAVKSVFKSHPSACLLMLSKAMDSRKGTIVNQRLHDDGNCP
ncbi:hypothetical protein AMTR_s00006p00264570, partial [Amborella trichopoda]